MSNYEFTFLNLEGVTADSIYESGNLKPVTIGDLLKNEVAIRQLVNEHNIVRKELYEQRKVLIEKDNEITLLKITPFVASLALILNIIGAVLIGYGCNILAFDTKSLLGSNLLYLGIASLFFAGISTIFYLPIAKWLNRKQETQKDNKENAQKRAEKVILTDVKKEIDKNAHT